METLTKLSKIYTKVLSQLGLVRQHSKVGKDNCVEIDRSNFENCTIDGIVAFSLAGAGAGGEHGGLWMIAIDGCQYHTNTIENKFSPDELRKICPPLEHCSFSYFGGDGRKGWNMHYMGMGNFMAVHDCIKKQFEDKTQGFSPYDIYMNWKDIVINILKEHG